MGLRVLHDREFQYIRVYPPGAEIPGLNDETDQAFNSGLRARLNQQEVAVILALRSQYDKALREGQIDDSGGVTISFEALAIAMKNLLHRGLPEQMTERRQLLKRIRQLRLVQINSEDDQDGGESWLRIRPQIVNFVSDAALSILRGESPEETSRTQASDSPNQQPATDQH